jgi:hypothetical protein
MVYKTVISDVALKFAVAAEVHWRDKSKKY